MTYRRFPLPWSGPCPSGSFHNTHSDADGNKFCEFCNHELYDPRDITLGQLVKDIDELRVLADKQEDHMDDGKLKEIAARFEALLLSGAKKEDSSQVPDDDDDAKEVCVGRLDEARHSWVVADPDNGGDGRSYCEYCGADGDA